MKWRDQLALLLGAASPLGLMSQSSLAAEPRAADDGLRADPPEVQKDLLVFRDPAERARLLLFAGHRSHSSHSSHRSHYSGSSGHSSHSSHYSSSGGYVTPAPVYTAPPKPKAKPKPAPTYLPPASSVRSYTADEPVNSLYSDPPASPSTAAGSQQRLTTGEVTSMVTKVQVALVVRGYDPGPVDGKLGGKTRIALGRFQAANGLPISGAMDVETLRLLGVEVAMPSLKPPEAEPAVATGEITRPDWARKPSGDDMARYYPDRAQRMEVNGRATIRCTVTTKGTLENCVVTSETPEDFGFGDAALRLSRLFRMKPLSLDGLTATGKTVVVPIVFQVPV
jgi:His-Xaa-Ser repeat protein HxsA